MSENDGAIIQTSGLTKKYGDFAAVDGVDLSIKPGEIFGLLGPNGAGKTTLISMLCTTVMPSSGSASINSFDVVARPGDVRRNIGIVFQEQSLDDRLTGRENLELHATLYGLDAATASQRIASVLDLVELKDKADALVRTYSGGMRRRLEIGRGLVHYPKVLFLDEPTIGLDPQTREHIWAYVKDLAKREQITILMTTHYMEEAEMLCTRIAIIDHGKIIALGTPDELKSMLGGETVVLKLRDADTPAVREKVQATFPDAKLFDGSMVLSVKAAEKEISGVLEQARSAGIDVLETSMHRPTLNDVFLKLTGREIRDEKAGTADAMRAFGRMHRH
ncbi:MAG: ATP-binding cassette domain-containing protein [Candidatus Aenigmarchaeota archaeon]|nr:ATP-binding cassette domain-containing protein [Candidatus Aenigmarchaeota archaeon]